jgi:gamma-glutamyltranspeptidase / glutathione hydrolase
LRDLQLPSRSPAMAMNGMAATQNPHATRTAIEVLQSGGAAIDAAVAAAAVLAVVEPNQTGIGGDCFVIMARNGTDELVAYNGSGRAPLDIPRDEIVNSAGNLDDSSPHTVTIPGAVDAWTRLVGDHGRKDIAELLAPAIAFARDGFPVHPRVASEWASEEPRLRRDANATRLFLPRGRAMREGEVFRNPGLAEALTLIAKKGRDGFYKGAVAGDIVSYLRSLGGSHTLEDLETTAGEYVEPVRTTYRGMEVCQIPPNNQGITTLLMLNILEGYDLASLGPMSAQRLHLEIEAGRLAYRDRDAFVCDTRHAAFPKQEILSKDYAARLRSAIRADRMMDHLPPALMRRSETVYITVVDRDRNSVSLINSIYGPFGSIRVAPTYGIILQNRGMGFSLDPGHPNAIGPRKRPLHTIMPGLAIKDARPFLSYGVVGADYQPFGHTHVLTGIADFGLDPQEAIDQVRVFYSGGDTLVERGLSLETAQELDRLGHHVVEAREPLGGGQMIKIDWSEGVLVGGSDPRLDGIALGY